ncbi:hypothetical protein BV20DRAFT_909024, partial [Pilatotrama ljubarskyi]
DRTRVATRASQLSKKVDPNAVLEKILDSSVTLSMREVVGVSKEVASCLQDALKVKRADFVSAPASNLVTTTPNQLIRLTMECNQRPVSFIVDTGSQLNIISEKVCKSIVRRPINTAKAITMNDANGGTGKLLGLVEDVPLKLGHVRTPIDAYVAENPPFPGLLGRPWQVAHKIGIEERDDGTYLTFPNKEGYPRSEILVTPSAYIPDASLGVYSAIVKEWSQDEAPCIVDSQPGGNDCDDDVPDLISASSSDNESEGVQSIDSNEVSVPASVSSETDSDDEASSDEEFFVDEDGDSYTLDHVLGLLSVREGSEEDAERMEKKVFWKVRRMLEAQSPELSSVRAGPCTIMAGSSVEFPRSTPGTVSRAFLLRDAKVFNRAGGCSGHVIVKVIPYTRKNYRRFEQLEDDSIREVSVASVQIDDAPVSHGAVTLMRPAVPTPAPVVSLRTWLCGYNVPFLIDTGSQIDCIHANMWRSIGTTHSLVRTNNRLVNVTGTRLRCLGVWKVMITVGTITSPIDLHVVESLTAPGIPGRPWQEHNQMWMDHTLDGVQVGIRSRDGFHTY